MIEEYREATRRAPGQRHPACRRALSRYCIPVATISIPPALAACSCASSAACPHRLPLGDARRRAMTAGQAAAAALHCGWAPRLATAARLSLGQPSTAALV